MFFIKIAIPFFVYFSAQATQLPTLKAKQSLDNIRFISKDGKYTYYQRRSGNLQVSTNYSNEEVLDGEKHTEYFIHSGLLAGEPVYRKIANKVNTLGIRTETALSGQRIFLDTGMAL